MGLGLAQKIKLAEKLILFNMVKSAKSTKKDIKYLKQQIRWREEYLQKSASTILEIRGKQNALLVAAMAETELISKLKRYRYKAVGDSRGKNPFITNEKPLEVRRKVKQDVKVFTPNKNFEIEKHFKRENTGNSLKEKFLNWTRVQKMGTPEAEFNDRESQALVPKQV